MNVGASEHVLHHLSVSRRLCDNELIIVELADGEEVPASKCSIFNMTIGSKNQVSCSAKYTQTHRLSSYPVCDWMTLV